MRIQQTDAGFIQTHAPDRAVLKPAEKASTVGHALPARPQVHFGEGGPLDIDGVFGDFVMDVSVRKRPLPEALHNILKRFQANRKINAMIMEAVLKYKDSGEQLEDYVEKETQRIETDLGLNPNPPSEDKSEKPVPQK